MKFKAFALGLLFVLCPLLSFAAAVPVDNLWSGLLDFNGQMLSGGKVYFYSAGTTSLKTIWTDAAESTEAANPVTLDAYGRAEVYADGTYKVRVTDSAGVVQMEVDNCEYKSSLSPASFTVTGPITAASLNVGTFTANAGIIASVTVSQAILTNSTISLASITNSYILTQNPLVASQAANKFYVDASIATKDAELATITASITALISSDTYLLGRINALASSPTRISNGMSSGGGTFYGAGLTEINSGYSVTLNAQSKTQIQGVLELAPSVNEVASYSIFSASVGYMAPSISSSTFYPGKTYYCRVPQVDNGDLEMRYIPFNLLVLNPSATSTALIYLNLSQSTYSSGDGITWSVVVDTVTAYPW